MKNNIIIITLIAVLIAGGGGFFAGMEFQKSQRSAQFGQFNSQRAGRGNGQNGNFRPVRGEVISSDDKSITVKSQDGSSKIVIISGSVSITEATSTGKESLKKGSQVMVFGSENSDGSVTAQNIQLNPQFRGPNGNQR